MDRDELVSQLLNAVSNLPPQETDSSTLWDMFYAKALCIVDQLCPLKLQRFYADTVSYITDELMSLMKARYKAFKKARETTNRNDWNMARLMRSKVPKLNMHLF